MAEFKCVVDLEGPDSGGGQHLWVSRDADFAYVDDMTGELVLILNKDCPRTEVERFNPRKWIGYSMSPNAPKEAGDQDPPLFESRN